LACSRVTPGFSRATTSASFVPTCLITRAATDVVTTGARLECEFAQRFLMCNSIHAPAQEPNRIVQSEPPRERPWHQARVARLPDELQGRRTTSDPADRVMCRWARCRCILVRLVTREE
jgi:hypothetical protein